MGVCVCVCVCVSVWGRGVHVGVGVCFVCHVCVCMSVCVSVCVGFVRPCVRLRVFCVHVSMCMRVHTCLWTRE